MYVVARRPCCKVGKPFPLDERRSDVEPDVPEDPGRYADDRVRNVAEVAAALKSASPTDLVRLGIVRGGTSPTLRCPRRDRETDERLARETASLVRQAGAALARGGGVGAHRLARRRVHEARARP